MVLKHLCDVNVCVRWERSCLWNLLVVMNLICWFRKASKKLWPTVIEVWRKVLFSQACVTHSVHRGGCPGGRNLVWGCVCVKGMVRQGGAMLRPTLDKAPTPPPPPLQTRHLPPPPTPSDQAPTPPTPGYAMIRLTGGRYASYWNAFLFYMQGRQCTAEENIVL